MTVSGPKTENKISDKISFVILLVFAAVCFYLHFRRIFFNVFWVDTAFSVDLIRLPFLQMLEATSVNEHPPFFYIFGKAVRLLLGDHPYAFRASAFIPYIGILILATTFIRKNFGYAPAYIIVGFSSFTPASIVYVMETRMYELGCFMALISFLCMYLIITKPSGRRQLYWHIFFVFSILTAYTHYYLTVAVCVMYLSLIVYCTLYKTEIRKCVLFSVTAIVSYLPWLGVMIRNFGVRSDGWWAEGYSHFDETMREIFGLKRYYIPALFLILVMIVIYVLDLRKSREFPDKKKTLTAELYFVVSGIAIIGFTFLTGAAVSTFVRPMFLSRFIYPLAGIGWLLFGLAIERIVSQITESVNKRIAVASFCAAVFSASLIMTCFETYKENVALQADFSYKTETFLALVKIPYGEVIYSDIEQEEFTIAGCYFPDTTVHVENAQFFYSIPEEDRFYLVWQDSAVETVTENLNSYGFSVTVLESGGTLGTQSGVSVLLCKKY